jgi:hypothetical protein
MAEQGPSGYCSYSRYCFVYCSIRISLHVMNSVYSRLIHHSSTHLYVFISHLLHSPSRHRSPCEDLASTGCSAPWRLVRTIRLLIPGSHGCKLRPIQLNAAIFNNDRTFGAWLFFAVTYAIMQCRLVYKHRL